MDLFEARRQFVLRLISDRFGGSQSAFAQEIGISPSYVSRMLKGEGEKDRKRIGEDTALRIENTLQLDPGALLRPVLPDRVSSRNQAEGRHRQEEGRPLQERRLIGAISLAVMDVEASMGHGVSQPAHENVVMNMSVDEGWLRRHASFSSPDSLAILIGIGDSMRPTFEDGDPLLVDRGVTEIKQDAVYVLALDDQLYVKRVQRLGDGNYTMISDNQNYRPQTVRSSDRDRFKVLGRVVMALRRI